MSERAKLITFTSDHKGANPKHTRYWPHYTDEHGRYRMSVFCVWSENDIARIVREEKYEHLSNEDFIARLGVEPLPEGATATLMAMGRGSYHAAFNHSPFAQWP